MSDPILPFDTWDSGTNQNSIPANDNALRSEILNGDIISDSTDAQPGSPSNGDIYIITGSATGAQWATFDEFDLAIYRAGTWKAFAPVEGIVVNLAGTLKRWNGSAYVDAVAGGGGGAPPVVTESTTNLDATGANAGNYTRFTNSSAKTYTFDDAETFTAGDEYHGRNANTGNLTITPAGTMTINAPAGGTLVVPPSGTFTVKIVAADEADLIGVTVAA
jgi:hypothetical protein